jgi:hypothetical protein
MLITFGTPYYGSLQALGFLVNGYPIKKGPITLFDFSAVMRSFPSAYQLLPMYRALRIGEGDLVNVRDAVDRIPNTVPDEVRDAIAFHDEINAAVKAHRDNSAYITAGYERHPIVGAEQPTAVCATITEDRHAALEYSYPGVTWTGDSTVPWISAHPGDDPKGTVEAGVYRTERHGSLQNSDDVLLEVRNLIGRLVAMPEITREVQPFGIALELKDWNEDGTIDIKAACSLGPLYADVVDVASGQPAAERTRLQLVDGVHRGKITGLAAGAYRVTVAANTLVRPVTDICLVMAG